MQIFIMMSSKLALMTILLNQQISLLYSYVFQMHFLFLFILWFNKLSTCFLHKHYCIHSKLQRFHGFIFSDMFPVIVDKLKMIEECITSDSLTGYQLDNITECIGALEAVVHIAGSTNNQKAKFNRR